MTQATFDDEELFGEAADEVRADVEAALEDARAALPDPDDVWDADADNVLGVLNGLRSAMDPGDAGEHLREARKWFTMGERADAFEDPDALEAEIEAVEGVVADMADSRDAVSDLAGTVPELRSALADAHEAAGGRDADADDGSTAAEDEAAEEADEPEGETDAVGDEGDDGEVADEEEEEEEASVDDAEGEPDEEAAADGGSADGGEQATLEGDD